MTMSTTIRDIKDGEHTRLGQQIGNAYRDSYIAAGLPADQAEAMASTSVRAAFLPPQENTPSYWTIRVAADHDDRPVGILLGGLAPQTRLATIVHVWVDPAAPDGDGVTHALLADFEALARDAGIERIQFCVAALDHLQRLCEEVGYDVKSTAMTRRFDPHG